MRVSLHASTRHEHIVRWKPMSYYDSITITNINRAKGSGSAGSTVCCSCRKNRENMADAYISVSSNDRTPGSWDRAYSLSYRQPSLK